MHKSKRLGAIVFALWAVLIPLWDSQSANAQSEQVQPLYDVRLAGGETAVGLSPAEVRRAYGFDRIENRGAGQIIGIVDSFDHPNIEQDLAVFNNQFGLPACTTKNGWPSRERKFVNGCNFL